MSKKLYVGNLPFSATEELWDRRVFPIDSWYGEQVVNRPQPKRSREIVLMTSFAALSM